MPMNGWVVAIFIVMAIAVVMQMLILAGIFVEFKRISRETHQTIQETQKRLDPILLRTNRILENSEEKIESIVSDASEMTRLARGQAQKIDRVVSEGLERMRAQIIRTDTIITGTLEAVEDAGVRVRRSVLGPLQQASAVLKGIRTGIDYIRGEHASRSDAAPSPDEELFI